MSINAVQQQIQTYLNHLSVTGWTGSVDARVEQPVGDFAKLNTPLVFIWGAAGRETRDTIPRGGGWRGARHTLKLWIYGLQLANDPDRSWKFPVLMRAIEKALVTASPMPVQITDPQTAEVSKLMDVGEVFSWDYDVDRTLKDQRLIRNLCLLEVPVLEEQSGE